MKSFAVALVCNLHCVSLAVAGVKTDLQEDGLMGLVQTVRIETARFSKQDGQWVEGPRELLVTIMYDVKGNRIERVTPDNKMLYTYDAQGNLSAIVSYVPDGSLCKSGYPCDAQGRKLETRLSYDAQGRKLEARLSYFDGTLDQKIVYTYDDTGHLIEEVTSDQAGLILKIVYAYDGKGNLIEEDVYGPSGIKGQLFHTYDEQGRRIETTHHDSHDAPLGIDRVVTTYDTKGNTLEITTYYTEKVGVEEGKPIPPPAKFVYTDEWDARGNWIKQIQTHCTAETGKPICEPSMVTYRMITYYPEAETQ